MMKNLAYDLEKPEGYPKSNRGGTGRKLSAVSNVIQAIDLRGPRPGEGGGGGGGGVGGGGSGGGAGGAASGLPDEPENGSEVRDTMKKGIIIGILSKYLGEDKEKLGRSFGRVKEMVI